MAKTSIASWPPIILVIRRSWPPFRWRAIYMAAWHRQEPVIAGARATMRNTTLRASEKMVEVHHADEK